MRNPSLLAMTLYAAGDWIPVGMENQARALAMRHCEAEGRGNLVLLVKNKMLHNSRGGR